MSAREQRLMDLRAEVAVLEAQTRDEQLTSAVNAQNNIAAAILEAEKIAKTHMVSPTFKIGGFTATYNYGSWDVTNDEDSWDSSWSSSNQEC